MCAVVRRLLIKRVSVGRGGLGAIEPGLEKSRRSPEEQLEGSPGIWQQRGLECRS